MIHPGPTYRNRSSTIQIDVHPQMGCRINQTCILLCIFVQFELCAMHVFTLTTRVTECRPTTWIFFKSFALAYLGLPRPVPIQLRIQISEGWRQWTTSSHKSHTRGYALQNAPVQSTGSCQYSLPAHADSATGSNV